MKISNCRLCNGKLTLVLSLGDFPIPNYFPKIQELGREKRYPLDFCVCVKCGLAQLGFIVHPQKIFENYHFLTSASKPLIDHLRNLAKTCIQDFKLTKKSKVLDIGCNDGTFLETFKKQGIFSLGIEPASNAAKIAKRSGIPIIQDFFNEKSSAKILKDYGHFDLITATRVLANVLDLKNFVRGICNILNENGVFVAEFGSLREMLLKNQFDSIYHEHYSYFSLNSIQKLLADFGLNIFRVEKTSLQGGELRIFASHSNKITNYESHIADLDYINFARNVENHRKKIKDLFSHIKKATIVGFGAPAKAVTLLNYCNLGKDVIRLIVDSTPYKQGRFLPGVHIPIYSEDYLNGKNVDFILLLAWNYKDQILEKIHKLGKNVKIIIPFPKLKVVE